MSATLEYSWGHRHVNELGVGEQLNADHVDFLRDPVYRRHRFPPEVISYAVWLYFRLPLSLRMVEEMLGGARRGLRDLRNRTPVGEEVRQKRSPIRSASARLLAATNGIYG